MCQRCNNGPETLNHILQVCPSTHLSRIKRHDNVKNYLIRSLSQKGFSVHNEPKFNTSSGLLKPDIVAYSPSRVIVIDVQVINDQISLSHAHEFKSNKYKVPLTPLLAGLRQAGVLFTSLTANWRGCISASSFRELHNHRILSKSDFKVISSRVVIGGIAAHNSFQRMTLRRRVLMKEAGM